MHPSIHARANPDKAAMIMAGSGEVLTYGQLEAGSNRYAHLYRSLGLARGDTVAVFLDNTSAFILLAWAAQRAGLFFVCVSAKLTASEVSFIVQDSGAKLLISSAAVGTVPSQLPAALPDVHLFALGEPMVGYRDLEAESATFPTTPIADQSAGTDMLYSSGTTGRPKGIRINLPADQSILAPTPFSGLLQQLWNFSPDTTYLSPAPLYHAAPLRAIMVVHKLGGTAVIMERFDPEDALSLIERYRVTHSQWVPTHFIRMLKLPAEARSRHDLSSLRYVIHAAAPCPIPVKEAMIAWLGEIIYEYYGGTEGNGLTAINSQEWLAHRGSVGRAVLGTIYICDEAGDPLPARSEGAVYFEGGNQFEYHNDPEKTADARNRHGWTTLGDVGWLDEEGYLYLTDRKSFMIISGGVNIYPQEIENHLITHPKVLDVAVIGAPDAEMGEKVVAVVQPLDWADAGEQLRQDLDRFAREALSSVKVPRQIDFAIELPRHATGKLYKRLLRDEYWK